MGSARGVIRIGLVALALCIGCWLLHKVLPVSRAAGVLDRAPYVQRATPTAVTVVWRSVGEGIPSFRYGLLPDQLTLELALDSIHVIRNPGRVYDRSRQKLMDTDHGAVQYEATLTGLSPGTTYYYEVGTKDLVAGQLDGSFRTLPVPDTEMPVRVWALGCSGTGGADAIAVHAGMRTFVEATGRQLDLMLHLGDMAYHDGLDKEFQNGFFDPYGATLRSVPCYPAFGNHEGHSSNGPRQLGPYFDAFVLPTAGEAGGLPSGTESYYAYDIGRLHMISLNSYDESREPNGPMATWLRQDLERAKVADWIVAYWHHPPYSKGSHDSDVELRLIEMREKLMPILEAGGVDLVLTAHSHAYERSMLVDRAYDTPTESRGVVLDDGDGDPSGDGWYRKPAGIQPHAGTVVVVLGNGGATMFQRGTMPIMRTTMQVHGSLILDFDGPRCEARMIDQEGTVRDRFGIVKEGRAIASPLETPWQPVGPIIQPHVRQFLDQIEVSFVSTTRWPGESLHFTLDGTEPTKFSPIYDGRPIVLSQDAHIRVRAVDVQENRLSPVSCGRFKRYDAPVLASMKSVPTIESGLRRTAYAGSWKKLPDVDRLVPDDMSIVANVGPTWEGHHDDYALVFDGFVHIPVRDVYRFRLVSDDGSRLTIGDVELIDFDGLHPARSREQALGLDTGWHKVKIEYFEAKEAQVLRLLVASQTMGWTELPDAWWGHAATIE